MMKVTNKLIFLTMLVVGFTFLATACSQTDSTDTEETQTTVEETKAVVPSVDYVDGTYEGVGAGVHGDEVKVQVTVTDGLITDITVTENNESEGIGTTPIEKIPAAIIEKQSTEVDVISGATATSEAVINAVKDALSKAQ